MSGEVDLHTAPTLREKVNELVSEGHSRIALDLSGLGFMDSTGLGVLIGSLKRLKERDGELALVGPQPPVRRILSITGLDRVFPIHDSLADATSTG